jgi:hypothetical protein
MTVQCGDSCLNQKKAHRWVEKYQGGANGCGSLKMGPSVAGKTQINQSVRDNRRFCTDEFPSETCISYRNNMCKNGLRSNQNNVILMEAGNFWTDEPISFKIRAIS